MCFLKSPPQWHTFSLESSSPFYTSVLLCNLIYSLVQHDNPLNTMAFQSQMPNQDFLWQVFQKWVSLNTHPDVFYSRSGSKLSIPKLLRLIHVFLMIPELIAIDLDTSQPMNCRWHCPTGPGPRLILKLSGWWLVRVFRQLILFYIFDNPKMTHSLFVSFSSRNVR